jgi:hypothetical protein
MTLSEKSATFRDHALASNRLQWWENCRECALRQLDDAKGVPLDDRRAEICVTARKIFIRAVGATEMMADPKRKSHQDDDDSDKRRRQEEALDEALKNTFPASDPVSVVQPMASGHGAGI